jgi:3-oxoacyl-[acyl-carrier protein] reductase
MIAWVTGAASGIGAAIVDALLSAGAEVIAFDRARPRRSKKNVRAFEVDVTNPRAIDAAIDEALPRGATLDALVNNAGVFDSGSVVDLDEAKWRSMLDVNLIGAAHCTRCAVKRMSKKRGGRIVNIASIAAITATPFGAHYAASKAGLVALTKSAALELAKRKITVNAVLPGLVDTPMSRARAPVVDRLVSTRVPAARIAAPEEIAELVSFLLTSKTSYITGASLVIDGGLSLVGSI